jgi:hypothetical protein
VLAFRARSGPLPAAFRGEIASMILQQFPATWM